MDKEPFKICNKCGEKWSSRDTFLRDETVTPIGYQVFFEDLKQGLFLFNHSCDTTIAIQTDYFLDLYPGPFHEGRVKSDKRKCPGKCLTQNFLSPCSDKCRCAFISKMIDILKKYPEKRTGIRSSSLIVGRQ